MPAGGRSFNFELHWNQGTATSQDHPPLSEHLGCLRGNVTLEITSYYSERKLAGQIFDIAPVEPIETDSHSNRSQLVESMFLNDRTYHSCVFLKCRRKESDIIHKDVTRDPTRSP
jgi:hypothetical protein